MTSRGATWRSATALALLTTAIVAAGGNSAIAAEQAPGVRLQPGYGPAGSYVRLQGAHFCTHPCSDVSVVADGLQIASGIVVSRHGKFDTSVQIPGSAQPSTLRVVAQQKDATGVMRSAETTFNVVPEVAGPSVSLPPGNQQAPVGSGAAEPPVSSPTAARPTRTRVKTAAPSGAPSPTTRAAATSAAPEPAAAAERSRSTSGSSGWWIAGVTAAAVLLAGAAAVAVRLRRRRQPAHRI
ncbi:MAG: hypothetical protein JO222_08255 [Frankiales bacterium]|nr:hypothetical protein [Frankiales bacterium]